MNLDAPPNVEQAVPSFVVSNMDASVRFYETLGFVMTKSGFTRGTALVLAGAARRP
jgi:hypothetical protein